MAADRTPSAAKITQTDADGRVVWEGYPPDECASASRIPADQPQTWYFTFGVGQVNAGKFYKVEDATFSEARRRMVDVFGTTWAFQYDDTDWHKNGVSQEEKWNLTQIK